MSVPHPPPTRLPFLLALLAALVLPALVPGLAPAAPLAQREVRPDGLVVLHVERDSLPVVQIRLGLRAGQTAEPAPKAGLSSLTASLLKEGTTSRDSRQIAEEIEFVGGSLGAAGGGETASLSLTVLKKDLELGFALLADILLHPSFPPEEIDRKKKLVLGSIRRARENPGAVAGKAFARHLYGEHPLSWPAEGTEATLAAITREDIVDFHRRHYLPNNGWLVAVGDVGKQELDGLINKYLGSWKPGELPDAALPAPPVLDRTRTVLIDRDISQAHIRLGHLGLERTHPDYYPVLVMNYILGGGGFASRLMDNIRDNRGLAYSVYSAFVPGSATGSFRAALETKNESANTAIEEVLQEMRRIRSEPVSEQELADAQAYITGSFPLRMDSNGKLADLISSVEFFGLGMNYVEDYLAAVRAVTREDVLRVAKAWLHPDRYQLVVVARQDEARIQADGEVLIESD